MKTTPFRIEIASSVLDDLAVRLSRTRFPDEPEGAGWGAGTNLSFMRELTRHWQERYDWRAQERALNVYPQFRADVDGLDVHFLHVRGKHASCTPLLLIHAFPDSFYRFVKALPFLSEHFHVVIPSLPGFGFSSHTAQDVDGYAQTLAALMAGLGYERYVAGGGDGPIPIAMSQLYPERLQGIYVVDVGYPTGAEDIATLSPPEQEFAGWIQGWWMREGAFNMIQSTKPQSLAFALNDSPVGLAAWLMILFASGTEDVLSRFSMDELITNAMIYWATESIGSAMRMYLETARSSYRQPPPPQRPRSPVPAAFARMPLDAPAPREWAARQVNLVQFSELERGGHHSSWEVPELFASDLIAFLAKLPAEA
jgi:pimeloyl-ACP methyl ester carboxylesterase